MSQGEWAIDPGLAERFRAAGAQIAWRDARPERAGARPKGRRPAPAGKARRRSSAARIAHLNEEEARFEEELEGELVTCTVDSGPLGALLLLLEVQRRGPPSSLSTRMAEASSPFPQGAILAQWAGGPPNASEALPPRDLIALARYALA